MSDVSSSQSSIRSMLLALIPTVILAFGSFVYTTVDTARRGRLEFVRGQIGKWREYIAHVAIPLPFETIEP